MRPREELSKILIVDDEPSIRHFIASILSEHYAILSAGSGLEAVRMARGEKPDLILLDILMPGNDGIACLQELRTRPETAELPILMLTAVNEPDVRVKAFTAGADDFIAKPFQPDELVARIESKLNRFKNLSNVTSLVLRLGNVALDLASLRVTVGDNDTNLGPVEFKILSLLMRQRGRLTRREDIENFVWPHEAPSERGLDSHIFALRRKLQDSTLLVQTIYGSGYSLTVKAHDAN